jgi:hypothetical protein
MLAVRELGAASLCTRLCRPASAQHDMVARSLSCAEDDLNTCASWRLEFVHAVQEGRAVPELEKPARRRGLVVRTRSLTPARSGGWPTRASPAMAATTAAARAWSRQWRPAAAAARGRPSLAPTRPGLTWAARVAARTGARAPAAHTAAACLAWLRCASWCVRARRGATPGGTLRVTCVPLSRCLPWRDARRRHVCQHPHMLPSTLCAAPDLHGVISQSDRAA